MNISKLMDEKFILPQLQCTDLDQLLSQIVELAVQSPLLEKIDKNTIKQALLDREQLGSTAFGNGIAIPHCALENVKGFIVGFIRIPDGLEMNSLDGKLVNLVFFIIGSKADRATHIHLLSKVSKVLNSKDGRKELLAQTTSKTLLETFLKYASDEVITKKNKKSALAHIFVQNEDWFTEILQILPEINTSVISIIKTDDTNHYLDALPLFSGFLVEKNDFNRIIVCVIPSVFANDLIRRVNDIVGDLHLAKGIKIVMQEIFINLGNIDY